MAVNLIIIILKNFRLNLSHVVICLKKILFDRIMSEDFLDCTQYMH